MAASIQHPRYRLFLRAVIRPETFLAGTFAVLILAGTLLLHLPLSQQRGEIGWIDCLFTATSAVCVTGLVTHDTGQDFTRFGQTVILVLIQTGGLGMMTFTALAAQIVGRRISLRSQMALQDVFFQQHAAEEFRAHLRRIAALVFAIEALGAGLLWLDAPPHLSSGQAAFTAVFHSVSAFCNAGFSTYSGNMMDVQGHGLFLTMIAVLIICGGLGYSVLIEVFTRFWQTLRGRRVPLSWSLNTRVVLTTSIGLIAVGGLMLAIFGFNGRQEGTFGRVGHAVFQSISARTAGFNTVDLSIAPTVSLLWLILLMFIGGSPGSCAGGVKTTSLAVWLARLWARLHHREDVTMWNRRIPTELVRRTGLLVAVCAVFNMIGVMILAALEPARSGCRLEDILFEQISAFGTVGLSTGITPTLHDLSKLWITCTMFVGRVGPLTLAVMIMDRKPPAVRLPEERLMIG